MQACGKASGKIGGGPYEKGRKWKGGGGQEEREGAALGECRYRKRVVYSKEKREKKKKKEIRTLI